MIEKFTCAVSGHVYNPEKDEPLHNIPSGRGFFTRSDDWQCPICRASKQQFSKE